MKRSYDTITLNLTPTAARREKLDGVDYVVAPAVIMAEGVWESSEGPLLYLNEELSRHPQTWNHKPSVEDHPTVNGAGVSACDPAVLAAYKRGLLLNTGWDGRLKTEVWLDEAKCKKTMPLVLGKVLRGETVEVSTGLYHDVEETPGVWNGKPYVGIVRNIQPDHLAILPDKKGAFSTADGGGLCRNAAPAAGELSYNDVRDQAKSLLKDMVAEVAAARQSGAAYGGPLPADMPTDYYCYVCDVFPKYLVFEMGDRAYKLGYKVKDSKVSFTGAPEEVRKVTSYITANAAPEEVARRALVQGAFVATYPDQAQDPEWLQDVAADFVVWQKDGKLFRLPFEYDEGNITFVGMPQAVERFSSYRPTANNSTQEPNVTQQNATPPNPTQRQQPTTNVVPVSSLTGGQPVAVTRADALARLLTGGQWTEADRGFLEGLDDARLGRIAGAQIAAPAPAPAANAQPPAAAQPQQQPVPQFLPQQAPLTNEQYLQQLPPAIRRMVQNGLAADAREKKQLIGIITNSPYNRYNPAWLETRDNEELRGMAALTGGLQPQQGAPAANYGGQGEVPMFLEPAAPTGNAADDEPALPIPMYSNDDFKRTA